MAAIFDIDKLVSNREQFLQSIKVSKNNLGKLEHYIQFIRGLKDPKKRQRFLWMNETCLVIKGTSPCADIVSKLYTAFFKTDFYLNLKENKNVLKNDVKLFLETNVFSVEASGLGRSLLESEAKILLDCFRTLKTDNNQPICSTEHQDIIDKLSFMIVCVKEQELVDKYIKNEIQPSDSLTKGGSEERDFLTFLAAIFEGANDVSNSDYTPIVMRVYTESVREIFIKNIYNNDVLKLQSALKQYQAYGDKLFVQRSLLNTFGLFLHSLKISLLPHKKVPAFYTCAKNILQEILRTETNTNNSLTRFKDYNEKHYVYLLTKYIAGSDILSKKDAHYSLGEPLQKLTISSTVSA